MATKRDLEQLADRLRSEFYRAMADQTRRLMTVMITTMVMSVVAAAGLAFGAARLVS